MKPAAFDYVAPRSLDEALAELRNSDGETRVLAGGQSLVPLLNFRLARPSRIVDLNRVAELQYVHARDGGLAIGAMTRDARIERDARFKAEQPLVAEAIQYVGHAAIRSRGTFGGSLAHADPAAELPATAVCLGAELTLRSTRKIRRVAAEDFFRGYLTTMLEPDELLLETWLPPVRPSTGQAWVEFSRRHGDFALVGAAVSLTEVDGKISSTSIVLSGVAGSPYRARQAETLLTTAAYSPDAVRAAADAVRAGIDPDADIHGSREYRKHLAAVITERAIRLAHQRAVSESPVALDVRRMLESTSQRA
ncbi:MAG: FAD binding domain-containing protein [Chloroflexi bacterium]|nr:FAD binding domain-containing protein [Chloroflexota bacterium]MBV9547977.1 FAD binding domain-containing protein [Chloroflexota bacterium]